MSHACSEGSGMAAVWPFWTSSQHDLELAFGCIISEPGAPIFLSDCELPSSLSIYLFSSKIVRGSFLLLIAKNPEAG